MIVLHALWPWVTWSEQRGTAFRAIYREGPLCENQFIEVLVCRLLWLADQAWYHSGDGTNLHYYNSYQTSTKMPNSGHLRGFDEPCGQPLTFCSSCRFNFMFKYKCFFAEYFIPILGSGRCGVYFRGWPIILSVLRPRPSPESLYFVPLFCISICNRTW